MTDLKTLVEAIERYTNKQYVPDAFGRIDGSHSERNRDRNTIADAFCCQDAITRERLEALGGKQSSDYERRLVFDCGLRVSCFDDGEFFFQVQVVTTKPIWSEPRPAIQAMGDVAFLLWRLTRPEPTK